jgi:hypothetical protein
LNDWLAQHDVSETPLKHSRPRTMLGVGLFPYIQTIEAGNVTGASKLPPRSVAKGKPNATKHKLLPSRQHRVMR